MTVTVVLADDQAVVRDGLTLLLSASDDLEVVAAAPDGPSAVAANPRRPPTGPRSSTCGCRDSTVRASPPG